MAILYADDTICAIATPLGEGGIGVVRLSGGKALETADKVFRGAGGKGLSGMDSHTIRYGHIVNREGKALDEVMVSFFKAPRTYTREDMVEISTHGGARILRSVLEVLLQSGARHAEPGEFTKRAFLNGRLDLAQAEAVLDLIKAKTDAARDQALRQLQGEFSKEIGRLREKLLKLCAHVEAYVDFPEDDIEVYSRGEFLAQFEELAGDIQKLLKTFEQGAVLRDGILAVIVGRPNVGKSSLLNALLDRDRAIVSDMPGTTRDALEEDLEIAGVLIRIVDTAGIRSQSEGVEKIGIEKTREYMERAQFFLVVMDGSQELQDEDKKIYQEIRKKKHVLVVNKVDLSLCLTPEKLASLEPDQTCFVSVRENRGLEDLEKKIADLALDGGLQTESAVVTKARHRIALEKAYDAILKARGAFQKQLSLEFIAFDLREALDRLGEIVGEIYTDDILDIVFREFCIGK